MKRAQSGAMAGTFTLLVLALRAAADSPSFREVKLGAIPRACDWRSGERGWHCWGVVRGPDGEGECVWVDGRLGPEYDRIWRDSIVFSPDGKRMAYRARKDEKELVSVGGAEGSGYDEVTDPVFSPDSKHVAYCACSEGDKACVVVDGVEGPEYDWMWSDSIVFSPDGKHVAYLAARDMSDDTGFPGSKKLAVVDGVEGPEYDGILRNAPCFHPDGTLEFLATKGRYVELDARGRWRERDTPIVLYRVTVAPARH